jgi:hypothetical protein
MEVGHTIPARRWCGVCGVVQLGIGKTPKICIFPPKDWSSLLVSDGEFHVEPISHPADRCEIEHVIRLRLFPIFAVLSIARWREWLGRHQACCRLTILLGRCLYNVGIFGNTFAFE